MYSNASYELLEYTPTQRIVTNNASREKHVYDWRRWKGEDLLPRLRPLKAPYSSTAEHASLHSSNATPFRRLYLPPPIPTCFPSTNHHPPRHHPSTPLTTILSILSIATAPHSPIPPLPQSPPSQIPLPALYSHDLTFSPSSTRHRPNPLD